jgi:outer membrane receptor protein involved in Fe transport
MTKVSATLLAVVCSGLVSFSPREAPAQNTSAFQGDSARPNWSTSNSPLLRTVSFSVTDIALKDALDSLARRANIAITYTGRILPEQRRVSVHMAGATVEAVLRAILDGTGAVPAVAGSTGQILVVRATDPGSATVQPEATIGGKITDAKSGQPLANATVTLDGLVHRTTADSGTYEFTGVAAGNHTILVRRLGYSMVRRDVTAPSSGALAVDFALEQAALPLDQVVVTGTVVPTEVRAVPTPISVVTSSDIQRQNIGRVSQIYRGMVPGAVAWDEGARSFNSFVTARGASSLFVSPSIKTYIDGVEVSDAVKNAVDPSSIERIEILRGPEASTIYGSDASGGVMQIFTKRGDATLNRPRLEGKAMAGVVESPYGTGNAANQDYSLLVRGSQPAFGYSFGGSYTKTGAWTPGYYYSAPSVYGATHVQQGGLTLDVSGRYYARSFPFVYTPAEMALGIAAIGPDNSDYATRQTTYGAHLSYAITPHWSHQLTVGVDRLTFEYHRTAPLHQTPSDTLLTVYENEAGKTSVAYNTSLEWALSPKVGATLTGGLDYYLVNSFGYYAGGVGNAEGQLQSDPSIPPAPSRDRFTNSGYFGQAEVSFAKSLFLVGGVRAERNENFGNDFGLAVSPRAGVSYVRDMGGATIKSRIAYGESTRPPLPYLKVGQTSPYQVLLSNPNLGPERQRGVDGGIDVYLGAKRSLSVTYYNQVARDLISLVLVDASASPLTYQFQNIGRVRNSGWEIQGTTRVRGASLTVQYTMMRSRIEKLPQNYSGDYSIGDQVLSVPLHSGGATLTLPEIRGTAVSVSATYIGAHTNYDYFAIDSLSYLGAPYRGTQGLRAYWKEYPAFVKTNLNVTHAVTPEVSAMLSVDNVTDSHAVEEAPTTPVPGRTTMLGLRVNW